MHFEEYLDLVSDEQFLHNRILATTKDFIKLTLKYLNNFNKIDELTVFTSMLLALYNEDDKNIILFEKYGLYINLKEYGKLNYVKEFLESNIKYFRIPNINSEEYSILTPIKIIKYYLDTYEGTIEILKGFGLKDYGVFELELARLVKAEENKLISELSNRYFQNMQSETISYLDTVGKIYIMLLKNGNIKVVGYSENSLKATAYFLALFLFSNQNKRLNYKEVVTLLFNSYGVSLENILKILNIDLKDIEQNNPILVLENYFNYYRSSSNETIRSIFKDQIMNNPVINGVIKRILIACNIDCSIINELYKLFEEMIQLKDIKPSSEYNKDLNPAIILFLENSYRIHDLIVPKNGLPKIDGKIIQSVRDYVLIAFLINSYYVQGNLAQFFLDNGILLEDIYNLIGVKVDFEQLNGVEINDENLVVNFYKYLELSKAELNTMTILDIEKTIMSYTNTKTKVLNRIFYNKTSQHLPDDFFENLVKYFEEKEKKESEAIIDRFFSNIDISVYKYIKMVSVIYPGIKDQIPQSKNAQVVSLLLATGNITFYKNGLLIDYLNNIGLKSNDILKHFNISITRCEKPIYPKYLETDFADFVFDGYNKGKKKEDITIESILKNALNKKLCYSYQITLLLENLGLNYDSLENLEEKVLEFNKEKMQKKASDEIKRVKRLCIDWYTCLVSSYHVLDVLKVNSKSLSFKMNDEDFILLSLLIGFFKTDSQYKSYFENHGITLNYLLNTINCPIEQMVWETKKVDDLQLYHEYEILIKNMGYRYSLEYDKRTIDIAYIGRRLFDADIFKSDIIKRIINNDSVYDTIKRELMNEKMEPVKLTLDQILTQLEKQVAYKPEVDIINIDSIIEFILEGDRGLSKYSEYIQMQVTEINQSMNLDESLENIENMVENVYVDTPVKQKFFIKLFTSKDNSKNIQRKIDSDILSQLIEEIDTHINTLSIQVRKYREIFKVISLYLAAIKNYYDTSKNIHDLLELECTKLKAVQDNYSELLNVQQALDGITDKINGYERTNVLMKQQQFQIYQTIVNHLISRNALQTSKDDIIPIISSELLFSIGSISSRNALELSNNLIGLFKNVIQQNVSGAKSNLEILKKSSLPQETVDKIIADVGAYIDEIDKNREEILKLSSTEENTEKQEEPKVKKIRKKD